MVDMDANECGQQRCASFYLIHSGVRFIKFEMKFAHDRNQPNEQLLIKTNEISFCAVYLYFSLEKFPFRALSSPTDGVAAEGPEW